MNFTTFPWTNFSTNFTLDGALLDMASMSLTRRAIHYIDLYLVPLVVLVGLCGNLLSFVVFLFTYMRRISSSIYLAALSVADGAFLVCILVSWTMNTGLNLYHQEGWCQIFIYLTYLSSFLSVWYVVSFTVERYIAINLPLKRQELCTPKRAKIVVTGLAAFAAILYSFGAWSSGVTVMLNSPVCGPLSGYSEFVSIVNNVDTVITLILPFLAIMIMNVRIAYKVVQFYTRRKKMALRDITMLHELSGELQVCRRVPSRTRVIYTRNQVRVTKLLLTVSTIFLVLNLPRHTLRTYSFIMGLLDDTYQPSHSYIVWQKVFHFLYYLHFSVNLFLYSLMGKNFRKALVRLCRRIRHSVVEYTEKYSSLCCTGRRYVATERHFMLQANRPNRNLFV